MPCAAVAHTKQVNTSVTQEQYMWLGEKKDWVSHHEWSNLLLSQIINLLVSLLNLVHLCWLKACFNWTIWTHKNTVKMHENEFSKQCNLTTILYQFVNSKWLYNGLHALLNCTRIIQARFYGRDVFGIYTRCLMSLHEERTLRRAY